MAIDHRESKGEWLGHPNEGVVDGRVAMGMQATHDLTDDPGALDVTAIWSKAHLRHLEEYAPLDRL